MDKKSFLSFVVDKHFKIPSYQRDYAWTERQVNELIDDIIEVIDTQTNHYIGTFILCNDKQGSEYYVVDGQQRLTTITMLMNVLTNFFEDKERSTWRNNFINDGKERLELLGENKAFFAELLHGSSPTPSTGSQKLLAN